KEVILYGRDKGKLLAAGRELGADIETDLAQAVNGAGLIIVSVPIDSFTGVIKQLKPYLSSGQVVMDVTSVKVMPVRVMHEYLDNVTVLGTHPVFGPGARSARNQNFILTPTNDAEQTIANKVRDNLTEKGGLVTMMTPEEHDHLMAVVLGLSHFIAIASADVLLGFEQLQKMKAIGGPTYRVLLTLAESVITEDPELYASIQMNLPGLSEMEELFMKTAATWADIVKSGNREQFIEKMNLLKEKLPEADPDFGRSYRDMYKILDES
ncbi:MAG TPA: prephenate dehydrogenase, partial [Dehalococcoidia bacterium]|nr:prephenate dehydrogenase [Dehalococcoidia bacterium]